MNSFSPGFRGRARPLADRLPPGQYPTEQFPVRPAGPTPVPIDTWAFTVTTEQGRTHRWTWEEMMALPQQETAWAKLCPRTIQSGAKHSAGPVGQGNPWLKAALGEAANAAARADTFLGARYRRIVKRRGHAKALVAVARSILVIVWHLINDPDASYQELGSDWHRRHLDPARTIRDLVCRLQALGHQVALTSTPA